MNGPGHEFDPMFSPDGRWLAYVADESGNAVYVQPFPDLAVVGSSVPA